MQGVLRYLFDRDTSCSMGKQSSVPTAKMYFFVLLKILDDKVWNALLN